MKKILLSLLIVSLLLLTALLTVNKAGTVEGSSFIGQDYFATSTRYFPGNSLTNLTVINSGPSSLARITITGANTGVVRLWNATTSDVTKRTGNKATSSLTYVELPASLAAGTYDFDAIFDTGILYELVSGLAPTSTIMYR